MWQEKSEQEKSPAASMVDVVFRIECLSLPVDHATALSDAITLNTNLASTSAYSGVHAIHLAGSQNGWERPDSDAQTLMLSKRTRLRIRLPETEADRLISQLANQTLDVAGYPLHVLSGHTRKLDPVATLFSRYVYYDDMSPKSDEPTFVDRVVDECISFGFTPTKVLCGREQMISTSTGSIVARSVLLADVPSPHSLVLQDHGLGHFRIIGCGLLIPHKDTGAVQGQ